MTGVFSKDLQKIDPIEHEGEEEDGCSDNETGDPQDRLFHTDRDDRGDEDPGREGENSDGTLLR